jgi:hypothetical protein
MNKHLATSICLNLGAMRLQDANESRDQAAIAKEERDLRALAAKLTAHANWRAAEYRALRYSSKRYGCLLHAW